MKAFNDGYAANDEFESTSNGLQRGELVRDLLRHRIQLPPIPEDSLKRPQLDQLVADAVVPRGVLFVEAPSGYGKSHVVNDGLRASFAEQDAVRWISLNTRDNSPARFLALIATALDVPENGIPAQATVSDALGLVLVAASRQQPPERRILVLDNLQVLVNPAVAELLEQLVSEQPEALSLILISRKALPFETHSLELEQRFTHIESGQLELSRWETFEFFRQALNRDLLTSVAVENLYSLTEGWVTPLALYRRDLLRETERKPVQETPSVERFLKESVLGLLAPAQRHALQIMAEVQLCSDELFAVLATSLPEPGLTPSNALELGLPLKAMPGGGRWYRLNPLLQEWLRAPVLPGYSERMLRVSRWFGARQQFPEALKYALLSGDDREVVSIASEGSEALLLGQDTASLLRLRKSLPPQLLEQNVRLRIVYGWVHAIGGQLRQARALVEAMKAQDFQDQEARLCALQAFILRGEGRVQTALEMADRALSAGALSTQGQLVTQMVRTSALSAAGRFQDAREANRAAARLAREAGDSGSEALAVYSHARIEMGKGALKHAEQLLRTGLDTAVQELVRPARIGETRLQLNLALVLWHQGRTREVERLLDICGRHAEQSRDPGLLVVMTIRILMCAAQGNTDEAFVWIGRAERTMHAWQVDAVMFEPILEALKASCWLAQRQIDSAAHALEKLQPYRHGDYVPELFPMMPGLLDCLLVRVELARGEYVQARSTLNAISRHYQNIIPWGVELYIRLLDAVLVREEKGMAAAVKLLVAAVTDAAGEHFISPFSDLRNELRPLLEQGLSQCPEGRFRDHLGQLYGLTTALAAGTALAEPISEREQSVLELIARGLSNQEIADTLHISLHTVKTHARRINAKLSVKSRTQAIVRARELGLL